MHAATPPAGSAPVTATAEEALVGARSEPGPRQTLSELLAQCGPGSEKATLGALAGAARSEGPEEWERHFGRVLILVLDSLMGKPPELRDTALLCLQELVACLPGFFNDFAEVVASKLFETYSACGQAERKAAAAVDRTLERLVGVIEPARAMEILLPLVSSEGAPLLQAATRLLSLVLQRMPRQQVQGQLDNVLPGVVAAFGNPVPEVRKAAVFCLVDIYMILGEQVMPHLVKELTPSQLKLVTIYVGRQRREREPGAALDEHSVGF